MSKHNHNYTQYSNKPKPAPAEVKMDSVPEIAGVAKPDMVVEKAPIGVVNPAEVSVVNLVQETSQVVRPSLVQETIETKPVPETVTGMVVGCSKLNVRSEADLFADIVCVLDNRSEIAIDVNKSTRDWFYICTATGIEGYCMRKFVEAHL